MRGAVLKLYPVTILKLLNSEGADPVSGVGLRPLAFCDCGFEFYRGISVCLWWLLCVVQVDVSTTGRFPSRGASRARSERERERESVCVCVCVCVSECEHKNHVYLQ
jgi:hypothetical protein